jgi:HK97 family phage major capsid protein
MEEIKKVSEEAGSIYDKMSRIYADCKSENRELTAEESGRFDELNIKHNGLLKKEEQLKALANKNFSKVESIEKIAEATGKSVSKIEDEQAMQRQCLKSYLLVGFNGMSNEERAFVTRDQSSTTNTEGGYTVDQTMGSRIIESMANFGGMRSVASILTTAKGEQINYPTNDDTAQAGAWLAENAAASQADLVFGTIALNAWTLSSKYIPVSSQLLQDSSFDIEQYVVDQLAKRLGRGSNLAYTTGNGSSKPTGITTTSLVGKAAAAITATTFSEMLDLKYSVDRDYRTNGTWMFNDNTALAMKKIALASANQSLWQEGIIGGTPATIDGNPFTINNDMPDMAAGTHPILYGDFKQYMIRDAAGINIRRSNEVNFLKNQTTFLGELRTEGKLLDTAAVKHMRMANT